VHGWKLRWGPLLSCCPPGSAVMGAICRQGQCGGAEAWSRAQLQAGTNARAGGEEHQWRGSVPLQKSGQPFQHSGGFCTCAALGCQALGAAGRHQAPPCRIACNLPVDPCPRQPVSGRQGFHHPSVLISIHVWLTGGSVGMPTRLPAQPMQGRASPVPARLPHPSDPPLTAQAPCSHCLLPSSLCLKHLRWMFACNKEDKKRLGAS